MKLCILLLLLWRSASPVAHTDDFSDEPQPPPWLPDEFNPEVEPWNEPDIPNEILNKA